MKIIAADSGGAILKKDYEPICIVGTAAVMVEPPYRRPSAVVWKAFEYNLDERTPILNELSFCLELSNKFSVNVIHLDISLGGANLLDLNVKKLSNYKISPRGRKVLEKLIPQLKNMAKNFSNLKILLIGKESLVVRLAELTAGIYGFLYTINKFLNNENEEVLYGLPKMCSISLDNDYLTIKSLKPSEFDISITVHTSKNILNSIRLLEYPNPVASGFRVIKIKRKS